MLEQKGKVVIGKILSGLDDYAVFHFKTEENYFDRFGYPGTAAHKKEHGDFDKKVSDFKSDFDQGKIGLSIQLMNFLRDWLQNHIQGVDKKYGPFLNSKEIR